MLIDALKAWGTKIPPVERFIPYFPIPSPDGIEIMSLAKVLTNWNSYLEEQLHKLVDSIDEWGNVEYFDNYGCDLLIEQTRIRAKLIPGDVAYILNSDLLLDMRGLLEEMEDDGHLSEMIRERMEMIFKNCLDLLKEEYNEQRNNREMVETHPKD